jgi:glycosyltransferase involved in cell wall biosynthesis
LTAIQPIPYFPFLASKPQWATTPERTEQDVNVRHAPMFYVPKVLKSLDGLWLYCAVLKPLADLKRAGQLDIVDAHFGYPEGVGALIAAKKIGVPCVVTLRGFEAEYLDKPFIGPQIRYLLRNADGCICVGHFLRELALKNGANAETTSVIHNAIDNRLFFPGDRIEARQQLGFDSDIPIVVSVGHLIQRKRHHVLVSAFAELLKTRPDARLLIIGNANFDTRYAKRLREQIAYSGLGDSVHLMGNVDADKIGDYLRAADVFALGTQREGCCNSVLEALACGLPVVTTPVGDNTWFVKDNRNGYIVPVDDSVAMAMALSRAIGRKDWSRDEISASLEVGNWESVAAKVIQFLETIV